jgi:hypothetical protein
MLASLNFCYHFPIELDNFSHQSRGWLPPQVPKVTISLQEKYWYWKKKKKKKGIFLMQ